MTIRKTEERIESIGIPTRGKKVITVKTIWQLFDEMRTRGKERIPEMRAFELREKPEEWREIPFFSDYKISSYGNVLSYKNHKERLIAPGGADNFQLCISGHVYPFNAFFLVVCVFADKFD